jgi:LPS sulfotransferase NodH
MKRKTIVLCATQRCGSTMIVEDMRNSAVLGRPEEYFIPWSSEREAEWQREYRNILTRGASENGVVSFKVMANQLFEIEQCLGGGAMEGGRLFPRFKKMLGPVHWVYITRDNMLKQAISREMSRQTGVNHATADEKESHFAGNTLRGYREDYNNSAVYREDMIERALGDIVKENIIWKRFFSDWGIVPYRIQYETAVRNYPEYLRRMAKMVGEKLPEELPKRKMVRLYNEKNEEWYRKFSDSLLRKKIEGLW